jgi:adenosylmethionine-8-amino-7-oxononanoate aminotransferase
MAPEDRKEEVSKLFYGDMKKDYPTINHGKGVYLYDREGKAYIDAAGGAMVVTIGHGVEEIAKSMVKQAEKVCFAFPAQFRNEPQEKLAEKVIDLAPRGFSRVYFASGGTEANEAAIKIARQYHLEGGRPSKYKVISRWKSYHGGSIAALSITGRTVTRKPYMPLLIEFPKIPAPYCYRCPYDSAYPTCGVQCAHELERIIRLVGAEYISAFIAEPIIGSTAPGVTPPLEYYPIIRSICDRYEALFIADEVIMGFGRTGRNFCIEHWDVVPDMITCAKGLASGYAPLGGTVIHEKIVNAFLRGSGNFNHVFTFAGNPISCAVGVAVQEYVEKHRLVERVRVMGEYLFRKLSRLEDSSIVGNIRGKGFYAGIEFVKDKRSKQPFEKEAAVGKTIAKKCFEKGVIVHAGVDGMVDGELGDSLVICPPYIITEKEVDQVVDTIGKSIEETQKGLGL